MPDGATLALQRALADWILAPEPAEPAGLPEAHRRALDRHREGLAVYRDLARQSLSDPLEACFPVARALLEEAGTWEDLVSGFLAARCVPSGHYRDIAPAFLGWVADTGRGLDRWPFLLELLHFELLDQLVERWPEEAAASLRPVPEAGDRIELDPATRVVSYTHAVHLATVEAPVPAHTPAHLLAFRDAAGDFQLRELTAATAALLVGAQAAPFAEAAAGLGLEAGPAATLLEQLCAEGALTGFRR